MGNGVGAGVIVAGPTVMVPDFYLCHSYSCVSVIFPLSLQTGEAGKCSGLSPTGGHAYISLGGAL